MRPKSTFGLSICIVLSLATAAFLIARVLGWIQIHWITVVIACLVGAGSTFQIIREFLRKPYIKEFGHSDWTVANPDDRKGVFIKISKSEHGAGNKPNYTFLNKGLGYSVDLDVHADGGDLIIYHPENLFMPRYKSFVIRVI